MERAVCIANIDRKGQAMRKRGGILALIGGVALALIGSRLGLGIIAQGGAVALFYVGFSGVFQAREKT